MLMQEERELVVEYGKKMSADRLSTGTSGNISIYNAEKGLMAISPSGMDYFSTKPEDVVITDLDANIVDGSRKPSSEWALHTTFYKHKPHARAVVHTHSTFATVLACLGWSIEPVHYLVAYAGRQVPCIPYYPFGSLELAEAAWEGMKTDYNACLLGNHGLLAVGGSLSFVFDAAQQLEFLAKVYYHTRLAGGGVQLTPEQLDAVLGKFQSYRQA